MKTLVVHTKSLSPCGQCEMTLKRAKAEGLEYIEAPGIDTAERTEVLAHFKNTFGLSSAPIVEVFLGDPNNGTVIDRWAGFRPDKLKEHAS